MVAEHKIAQQCMKRKLVIWIEFSAGAEEAKFNHPPKIITQVNIPYFPLQRKETDSLFFSQAGGLEAANQLADS